MHRTRRITITARDESVEVLQEEARRRGVSLAVLVAEAVDEMAASLRRTRRPRVGVGRSTDAESAAEVSAEPVARPPA
jgi:hypothetical protein